MVVDAAQARLVGSVLLLLVPLLAVYGVVASRGGYWDAAFWASPRDRKLEHIAGHRREWLWIHAGWILILGVLAAGAAGLAALLAAAGEPALAGIGLGAFLVGVGGWLAGILLQGAPMHVATRVRRETGATPGWLEPLSTAAGLGEAAFVSLTALAYVVWGAAIVDGGFPGAWAGWVAVALGGASVAGVALAGERFTFPELPLLVPMVLGVALVID